MNSSTNNGSVNNNLNRSLPDVAASAVMSTAAAAAAKAKTSPKDEKRSAGLWNWRGIPERWKSFPSILRVRSRDETAARGSNTSEVLGRINSMSSMDKLRLRQGAIQALENVRTQITATVACERHVRPGSPISCAIKACLDQIDVEPQRSGPGMKRCRVGRYMLTNMETNKLQFIADQLEKDVERLNEELMKLLMLRDELNMQEDSLLVDIEDLTFT